MTANSGTLIASGSSPGSTGVLGAENTTGRTVTVNAGATLSMASSNVFWNGTSSPTNIPTLVINGGTVTTNSYNGISNVTLNGGTLTNTTTDNANYSAYEFLGGATVTVVGTSASTISSTSSGSVHLAGSHTTTFNVASTGAAGPDLTVSVKLRAGSGSTYVAGTSALAKTGAGTMLLSGANVYDGGTGINAGTLITGNISALGSGSVTVASGATLQIGNGTGSVHTVTLGSAANLVINGGTLKLDSQLGTTTPAITLSGGGKYTWTTGTLDLSGVFNSAGAGTYTLITGGTGNVDTAAPTIAGFSNGLDTASFANGILTLTAVPEPSAYGLIGAGALAAVAVVRRRRKALGR